MRINKYLPRIIDADQKGSMKGNYIGSNILELQHLKDYVNENKIAGLLMCIDFEKAFDTYEWELLYKALQCFNFGETLINWIKIFYNGCTSTFLNNGKSARRHVKLYHGLKQGDYISPILFLLCVQIDNINLKAKSKIKLITMHSISSLLKQHCDDTCITIDANHDSLVELERLFDRIAAQSGLKINYDKTEIVR